MVAYIKTKPTHKDKMDAEPSYRSNGNLFTWNQLSLVVDVVMLNCPRISQDHSIGIKAKTLFPLFH